MDQSSGLSHDAERFFEVTIGRPSHWDLDVVSLRGVEELSQPYRFDVVLATPLGAEPLVPAEALGAYARLVLACASGAPRVVHAVVAAVRAVGPVPGSEQARFRVRLVPALALLRHTRNSRIFQDRTLPQVVSAVLDDAGVAHRWACTATFAPRPYCVQHQESDFDFVTRLLAEEGIWYAFEHPSGDPDADSEVLVFADRETLYAPIGDERELALAPLEGAGTVECVTTFQAENVVRPGAVALRQFDFRRPATTLNSQANVARPARGLNEGQLGVYEHHAEYEDDKLSRRDADRLLAQLRRDARRGGGESTCARLAPGRYFELHAPSSAGLEGEYAVTRVEHRGRPRRMGTAAATATTTTTTTTRASRCTPTSFAAYRGR